MSVCSKVKNANVTHVTCNMHLIFLYKIVIGQSAISKPWRNREFQGRKVSVLIGESRSFPSPKSKGLKSMGKGQSRPP